MQLPWSKFSEYPLPLRNTSGILVTCPRQPHIQTLWSVIKKLSLKVHTAGCLFRFFSGLLYTFHLWLVKWNIDWQQLVFVPEILHVTRKVKIVQGEGKNEFLFSRCSMQKKRLLTIQAEHRTTRNGLVACRTASVNKIELYQAKALTSYGAITVKTWSNFLLKMCTVTSYGGETHSYHWLQAGFIVIWQFCIFMILSLFLKRRSLAVILHVNEETNTLIHNCPRF